MRCRYPFTCSMWPVSVRRSWPLAVSQIFIVRSAAQMGEEKTGEWKLSYVPQDTTGFYKQWQAQHKPA